MAGFSGIYGAQQQFYPQPYQPPYNPMLYNEQRMQHLLQTNPQLAQQAPQPVPQPMPQHMPMLKGRPVSNIEEARAAQIDFDGSVHVFTDVFNKRIYTKQLTDNGTVAFCVYVVQPEEQPVTVAQTDITNVVLEATAPLNARVMALETEVRRMGGAEYGDQPDATGKSAPAGRKPNGRPATTGGEPA